MKIWMIYCLLGVLNGLLIGFESAAVYHQAVLIETLESDLATANLRKAEYQAFARESLDAAEAWRNRQKACEVVLGSGVDWTKATNKWRKQRRCDSARFSITATGSGATPSYLWGMDPPKLNMDDVSWNGTDFGYSSIDWKRVEKIDSMKRDSAGMK